MKNPLTWFMVLGGGVAVAIVWWVVNQIGAAQKNNAANNDLDTILGN